MTAARIPPDGFINTPTARLEFRYKPAAEGAARPDTTLVFLHEGLGCIDMWRDFPDTLSAACGCAQLAYSRKGYGRSDPVALPRRPDFMHEEAVDSLPRVLAEFPFGRVVYIGHSDGASIALINAALAAPNNLAGIVLMAPHVFIEQISLDSIAVAARAYRDTDLRQRLMRYHGERVDGAFWGWNQVWRDASFADWSLTSMLADITVPTLLIQGKDDAYGTLKQLDAIAGGVTGPVSRHDLDACGHSPFRDQADATEQAIVEFVEQLP